MEADKLKGAGGFEGTRVFASVTMAEEGCKMWVVESNLFPSPDCLNGLDKSRLTGFSKASVGFMAVKEARFAPYLIDTGLPRMPRTKATRTWWPIGLGRRAGQGRGSSCVARC